MENILSATGRNLTAVASTVRLLDCLPNYAAFAKIITKFK